MPTPHPPDDPKPKAHPSFRVHERIVLNDIPRLPNPPAGKALPGSDHFRENFYPDQSSSCPVVTTSSPRSSTPRSSTPRSPRSEASSRSRSSSAHSRQLHSVGSQQSTPDSDHPKNLSMNLGTSEHRSEGSPPHQDDLYHKHTNENEQVAVRAPHVAPIIRKHGEPTSSMRDIGVESFGSPIAHAFRGERSKETLPWKKRIWFLRDCCPYERPALQAVLALQRETIIATQAITRMRPTRCATENPRILPWSSPHTTVAHSMRDDAITRAYPRAYPRERAVTVLRRILSNEF
jgi:hypothetical protein